MLRWLRDQPRAGAGRRAGPLRRRPVAGHRSRRSRDVDGARRRGDPVRPLAALGRRGAGQGLRPLVRRDPVADRPVRLTSRHRASGWARTFPPALPGSGRSGAGIRTTSAATPWVRSPSTTTTCVVALRTYLIEGDDLASERAVRAWHDWFPERGAGARQPGRAQCRRPEDRPLRFLRSRYRRRRVARSGGLRARMRTMQGLMMDVPLTITGILRHAAAESR